MATETENPEFEVQSVADQVYVVLRERIAGGELERGSRLHQEDLASEFGVSRTPVREALRRLAAEGLVDLFANRGARVASATHEQLRTSYETRLVVEPGAARLAAERRLEVPIARMRAAIRDEERAGRSAAKLLRANRDFHLALVEAAGNPELVAVHGARLDRSDRRGAVRGAPRPRRARRRQRGPQVDRGRDRGRRTPSRPSCSRVATSSARCNCSSTEADAGCQPSGVDPSRTWSVFRSE